MNSQSIKESVVRSMETLSTRITNRTKLLILGTRWFEDDPIDFYFQEAEKYPNDWIVAKFPAIALEDEYSPTTGRL